MVLLLLIVTPIAGFCNCSMFCCLLPFVYSRFAIISMGKRELVALLCSSSLCLVIVVWLFLTMPWVCLQAVIVVFLDHTHLLFWTWYSLEYLQLVCTVKTKSIKYVIQKIMASITIFMPWLTYEGIMRSIVIIKKGENAYGKSGKCVYKHFKCRERITI